MSAEILAIVVLPYEGNVLHVDLAGRPAGDHLFDALSEADGLEVKILGDDSIDLGAIRGFASVRLPLSAADARDLAEHDVLVIDARAWLTRTLLREMLAQAREAARGLILDNSDADRAVTLAVYFPRTLMRPGFIQRARTIAGRGLEHVLSAEALSRMTKVRAPDLDAAAPAQLIDGFVELARIEQVILLTRANDAMKRGIRIRDPRQVWIRGSLVGGSDVELDINVIIEGAVVLGDRVKIGANCVLKDTRIGTNTHVNPFSMMEGSSIGSDNIIGPYARIRPGSSFGDGVRIGNYVEVKNSQVGSRTRINHHAFIGDAEIAEDVTVGAGTITCNHDGVRINRTFIERGAYVGSGCNLIAPVRIGQGATVGAGSTITSDVPAAKLTLARSKQTTIENWRGPRRG